MLFHELYGRLDCVVVVVIIELLFGSGGRHGPVGLVIVIVHVGHDAAVDARRAVCFVAAVRVVVAIVGDGDLGLDDRREGELTLGCAQYSAHRCGITCVVVGRRVVFI